MITDKIAQLLAAHIETSIALADQLPESMIQAGLKITESLLADGKILLCAQGRAYANGLHFASSLINRYEVDLPPLPVVMLGSHASMFQAAVHEGQEDSLIAREIQALGHEQDTLLMLTVGTKAQGLLQALHAAKEKGMASIVLMGENEESLSTQLTERDLGIVLPTASINRILELQLLVLHGLCEVIDQTLFAQMLE